MKKSITMTVTMLTLAFAVQGHAGFGDLKKMVPGGDADASGVSQEAIVQQYGAASALVLGGQAELAEAFGLKEKAAEIRAQAESITGGATLSQDDLKKTRAVTGEAMALNQAKMEEGAELSEEGREHYIAGLLLSAQGVSATKDMADDASAFGVSAKDQISSASMMQKAKVTSKLAAGMYVVQELPGFTSALMSNFALLATYAKNADIPVPDEATDLLAAL